MPCGAEGEVVKRHSRGGGKSAETRRRKTVTLKRRNALKAARRSSASGQEGEVARLTRERDEALEQQTATSEVLQVPDGSNQKQSYGSKILATRISRGDLEARRIARLEQTCRDKFAKLAIWKRNEGARSVLVMEENDISSTNAERVFNAMMRAETGKPHPPDEIYLVSNFLPEIWRVTCLRRAWRDYYDDGERFHPFDPSNLTQLTKR